MSSIDSSSRYKIQGPVFSFAELAKNKPDMFLSPQKFTEAQIKEIAEHEKQVQRREEAVNRYAEAHPDPIHGQVMVDGKLFATVYDSGAFELPYRDPYLEKLSGSADTLLEQIAQHTKGEIKRSDFLPPLYGPGAVVPDSVLPPITARSPSDIFNELYEDLMRSRVAAAAENAG